MKILEQEREYTHTVAKFAIVCLFVYLLGYFRVHRKKGLVRFNCAGYLYDQERKPRFGFILSDSQHRIESIDQIGYRGRTKRSTQLKQRVNIPEWGEGVNVSITLLLS